MDVLSCQGKPLQTYQRQKGITLPLKGPLSPSSCSPSMQKLQLIGHADGGLHDQWYVSAQPLHRCIIAWHSVGAIRMPCSWLAPCKVCTCHHNLLTCIDASLCQSGSTAVAVVCHCSSDAKRWRWSVDMTDHNRFEVALPKSVGSCAPCHHPCAAIPHRAPRATPLATLAAMTCI